ncbi:hypothetical protein AgCh_016653 [Apium graveolens]
MNLLQFVDPSKVHMVGICGISGVGKTTTARAIYNLLHIHFEGSSFCEDVKGTAKLHGLPYLQNQLIDDITKAGDEYITSIGQGISVTKQLLNSKSVLIVLDDVSCIEQLKALAGSPSWFGLGSLIIVTGKDKQLLSAHGVKEIFEIELLNQAESLELFCLYAFKERQPKEEFIDLSYGVVNYVDGHPLALKVLGCFLFGKNVHIWTSEVNKLKSYNTFEIQQVLKLSYEGLDSNQKDIFLDIACFFHNKKRDLVRKILETCDMFPDSDLRVLVDKSFLTISRGQLILHELIKKMGKQVVREESENRGKRSRLWSQKDSYSVLNQSMGSESVKGFRLRLTSCQKVYIDSESFSRMKELRFLKIHYKPLESTLPNGIYHRNIIYEGTKVNHSKNLEYLSNELRWLCWHGYPFEFLPTTFLPKYLVALNLSYGNIKQLWTGTKSFEKLTIMELRFCHHLISTPDFTLIPNLEELYLEYCTNLIELHPSVGLLKKLIILNCNNCKKLKFFPRDLELESLQTLILSGCSMLDSLPQDLEKSEALLELRADGTNIRQFPSSTKYLNNIRELLIGGRIKIPPRSISSALVLPPLSGLRLIKNLDVSHCKLSEANLNDISSLLSLEKLNLSGNDFVSLPSNFSQLSGLKRLGLVGCKNLEILPVLPSMLDIIDAQDCTALKKLPSIMYESKSLRFDFSNCSKLAENQTIESLASMLLPQRRVDPFRAVNLFLPGTRVPEWFTNRNDGDSLRIELPQPWSYSKFKGFATCAVFSPQNPKGSKGRMIEVSYMVHSLNEAFLCGTAIETRIFPNETRCYESDQVWLSYMVPRPGWEFRWEKAKDYIVVEFEIYGIYCKVKECGVRLIYEENEAESSSRITEWLPNVVENK